jgi:glycine cleavage system H protein
MSAGLVGYRLCDREFDCERCPLDAALRGQGPSWTDTGGPAPHAVHFPDDRRYARGHTWVQAAGTGTRIGIDAMAAALLGRPTEVWLADGAAPSRGEPLCGLGLSCGALSLAAPVSGRDAVLNPALAEAPGLAADDPYGTGWLVELRHAAAPSDLVTADAAREATRLDLRHLRRRVALDLLKDLDPVGATLPDGGEASPDLRRMLGPGRYLALVRELVH